MVTPFRKDKEVDYAGVEALVAWYWKKGCDGIFAVCQSSEMFCLSLEERVKIGRTVVEKAKELARADRSRPPMKIVVSGHISDGLEEQVEELSAMAEVGADALILISNRMDRANTSEDAWIGELSDLIARLPAAIPLGMYECPKPYKRLLSARMLQACIDTGRFAFIKDTCCDAAVMKERVALLAGSGVGLYNANAQTLLETFRAGAAGYCGVMANFHPEIYRWLLHHPDREESELVQAFLGLAAFTETLSYPATAKYYLHAHEGLSIEPVCRVEGRGPVTDYQKSCLAQMKRLSDAVLNKLGTEKGVL